MYLKNNLNMQPDAPKIPKEALDLFFFKKKVANN